MAFPDGWLHIKNWEKYQSTATKSRGPWIKLWHTLFSDNQFMSLPRATRYDWIAILSLSGHQTHTGWIPNCSKTVTRLIQGCRNLDLQVFENLGFLETSCTLDKSRVEESRVEEPPKPPKGGNGFHLDYPEKFNRLWAAYPRGDGKGAALKAFKKISPDDEQTETILKSIQAHRESADWMRDQGQYIPHLSTYLNQRRWEDEEDNL